MWETVSAAVIGTSHRDLNGVCQDRCAVLCTQQGDRQWLAMFVADGAGSAPMAEVGAELAVTAALSFVESLMGRVEFGLSDNLAVELVKDVRSSIYLEASRSGHSARDYACTFLGLLSSELGTLAFQVGDGGIVIDSGDSMFVAIKPMSGIYANMTHFVTEEDAIDHLVCEFFPNIAQRAAVFSDGIQRLAINMDSNTPHEPFFSSFFDVLATIKPEKRNQLQGALESFLDSDQVNERTDDDKALALAVLRV